MTIKDKLLKGYPFTFPQAYYEYQWPNINTWYKVVINQDDEGNDILWVNEDERILGESFNVETLGSKYLKLYTYVLKRKIRIKIDLNNIIFKEDHIKK